MKTPTYYSTLGVAPDAGREVIRAAYKAKMMKYHPDKHRSDLAQAEAISKSLNEAFRVLDNPEQRALYDRSIGVNGESAYSIVVRRSPAAGAESFEGGLAARLLRPASAENMRTAVAGMLAGIAMIVWLSWT